MLITHDINIRDPAVSSVHLHNSVDDSFRCEILNENIHNKVKTLHLIYIKFLYLTMKLWV